MTRRLSDQCVVKYRRPRTATFGAEGRLLEALYPLLPFVDGCMRMLPHELDIDRIRLGLSLFLLGAIDRYWQRGSVDDRLFPAAADTLLGKHDMNPGTAFIAAAAPQVRGAQHGRSILLQGGELMDMWLDSRDANTLLGLPELARDWERFSRDFGRCAF